ncbi:MAG TPA: hypothetical protein VH352_02590 [Pseudonocardiaceae bacterium]|nr:hypothetical protein [Pseudonocardiaceae bacterium]
MKRTKITLVTATAVLAMAGGGIAFAAGSGGSAMPTTTPTATGPAAGAPAAGTPAAHGKHKARGLVGRVEHGEFTVHTKTGDQVVDVQRGQVTAVSATSVTVKSQDGFTATYAVGGDSKIRVKKQTAAISGVHTGDRVFVAALKNGGTDTVRGIADAGPAPAK